MEENRSSEQIKNPITEGSIPIQLLLFFFPILIGSLFQQLYNTVDAVIVGKYLGKAALGAVGGSTYMLINLIIYLFQGIANGAAVTAAHAYGAGRMEPFRIVVHTAMFLSAVIGGVFTVVGIWSFPMILRLIGTPEEVLGPASIYIVIYSMGYIPSCIYNVGAGLVRATGDSRRPLIYLAAACAVNIVLDFLFIAGLHWGVAGAAAATVMAQVISAVLVVILLFDKRKQYQMRISELRVDSEILKRIFSIGIPSGIQSDMYSIANLIMQIQVNTYGTNTVAALSAYEKIDGFFWMTMTAFGMAITTFCGQNFGAGKWERVKKGMHVCFSMAAVTAVAISAVFYRFAPQLMAWFTSDADVIEIGAGLMVELMPFYVAYVWTEVYAGGIRGCGESFIPMVITAVGVCLLRVIWTGVVAFTDGSAAMLMVGYPATWIITSAAIMVYYCKGSWMKKYIG
ncbi:MAG: MATE family efflux transporter [Lachnospiraceae bacterium]|nr:MATE family efflux transporter [Lachnospiraceae bacterium]